MDWSDGLFSAGQSSYSIRDGCRVVGIGNVLGGIGGELDGRNTVQGIIRIVDSGAIRIDLLDHVARFVIGVCGCPRVMRDDLVYSPEVIKAVLGLIVVGMVTDVKLSWVS